MRVAANMSKDVAEYYEGYNLDEIVNEMLCRYDITTLPSTSMRRGGQRVERVIDVTNEDFIVMKEHMPSRTKLLSLGRLLEYGYNIDILTNDDFMQHVSLSQKEKKQVTYIEHIDKAISHIEKAVSLLPEDSKQIRVLEDVIEILDVVRIQI